MGLFSRTGRTDRPVMNRFRKAAELLSPRSLMRAAGLGDSRASVEALEARQLLFTLTVTADDVNPATGLGTVQGFFGYAPPYLIPTVERPTEEPTPQIKTENFNEEQYGQFGSGAFFGDSNIQLIHSGVVAAIEGRLPPGDLEDNAARYLRIDLPDGGDRFSFRFFGDPDQDTGIRPRLSALNVQMEITGVSQLAANSNTPVQDLTGLVINRHRVELLFRDQVIATFQGAALQAALAATPNTNPANGVGTFTFQVPGATRLFDEIRIVAINDAVPGQDITAFAIDTFSYSRTTPQNKAPLEPSLRYAGVTLAGPVGASVTLTDLFGDDIVGTIAIGAHFGSDLLLIDTDDDGFPDFNRGIGQIRFSGVDSRTTMSLWGLDVQETDTVPVDAVYFEGGLAAFWVDDITGDGDFENDGHGFGYDIVNDEVTLTGIPNSPGSVLVGSPFLRNDGDDPYGPAGPPIVTDGYVNPDQGVFVENGQSMGSIHIHGIVMGSSRVDGSLQLWATSHMLGTLSVGGDLGTYVSATDAGLWAPDPDFVVTDPNITLEPVYKTGGQLIVGRTVGQIMIGGRSLVDVTVVGDLNAPNTRPPRSTFLYSEQEHVLGINPQITARGAININLTERSAPYGQASTDVFRNDSQAYVLGSGLFRNDTIAGAEYIGSASTGVRIRGEVSGRDIFNTTEDKVDVFAFAVDGTGEVVIQGVNATAGLLPMFRVVDERGRTIAAPEGAIADEDLRRFDAATIRFTPTEGASVYYLVVQDPTSDNATTSFTNVAYSIVITGLASTTLGSYRSGGGSGFASGNTTRANSVNVLSGSIGSLRVGMGWVDSAGTDADPTDSYNTPQGGDDSSSFQGGVFTTPGTIYNITSGGDIGVPNGNGTGRIDVRAGGDFGSLVTGVNPAVAGGVGDGDVNFLYLNIGGSFGYADISGGIGMDQDFEGDPRASVGPTGGFSLVTGEDGGAGDVGRIRTGFHVISDSFRVEVPAGSEIGQILISQDSYNDANARSGLYDGSLSLPVITGAGSDVRFVDFPRNVSPSSADHTFPLFGSTPREFVDDAGVRFTIEVLNGPTNVQVGTVRVLPIDNSQGVVVAQISVDLSNARTLRVATSSGDPDDVLSLGRIIVTQAGAGSTIEFDSTGPEIDVYRIDGRGALDGIFNRSINGDIVSIDAIALGTLEVRGNVGYTQNIGFGPSTYAPRLGIAADGPQAAVGAPIGMAFEAGETIDGDYNGNVYRPLNDDNYGGGTAYLEDLGMPMDEYANGIIVRTGNVTRIAVDGAVGDIILQDATAALTEAIINADQVTGFDGFDGLRGMVYAFDIDTIDVGDGISRAEVNTPIGSTGIFVANNLRRVIATASDGSPFIGGTIISANIRALGEDGEILLEGQADGIDSVEVLNGFVDDAHIATTRFDDYWASFLGYEDRQARGDIGTVQLTGSRIFRSRMFAGRVDEVLFNGGTWDATSLNATDGVGTITGDNIRNSTLTGDRLEFRVNEMLVGHDVDGINVRFDIADLVLNVVGDIRNSINAVNIIRGDFNIAGIVQGVNVSGDVRATSLEAGEVESFGLQGDLTGSTLSISGALNNLNVASIRNSLLEVTGPGGRIGTITSTGVFHGEVRSTGPVGTLTSTTNNVNIRLQTTGTNGSVQTIAAPMGSVILDADVAGSISSITAGKNIGSQTERVGAFILARENIGTVSAPNGQLYSDVRSSGTIGSVTLGRVDSKPGSSRVGHGSIIAQNRIQGVTINGDFAGDIISYTGGISNVTITNGSLHPNRIVAAYDGSIENFTLTGGDLLGSVYADYDIVNLSIAQDSARIFGNVGIDPFKSQFNAVAGDALRNQLPAGVSQDAALQGPRIQAGRDIRNVTVGGSVFESGFVAGRNIDAVRISGRIANDLFSAGRKGTFFAAGDSITNVSTAVNTADALFLAGVTNLGADDRPGGIGTNRDTVKSGNIGTLNLNATFGVAILAGVDAGSDGIYATTDDKQTLGVSTVSTVTAPVVVSNTQIVGDVLSSSILADGRFSNGQSNAPGNWKAQLLSAGVDADGAIPGTSFSGTQSFLSGGTTYTLTFSGPGVAIYNAGTNRLTLRNTTSASSLTVASNSGFIDGMTILSNDEASLGTLTFSNVLRGSTNVTIDAGIGTINSAGSVFSRNSLGNIDVANTPRITTGGDIATFTASSWNGGNITARAVGQFTVNGEFGGAVDTGEASLQALSLGSATIAGVTRALISIDRDSGQLTLTGGTDRTQIRVGGSLTSLSAGPLSQTVVAVYDTLGSVTVNGAMFDSAIAAGVDTGTDGAFDGTGSAADKLSSGFIGSVSIGGNFLESDITAGMLRGPDKFFGTRDDRISAGRSTIGTVNITGNSVGSARSSETYRISSSGTLGQVRVGGQNFTGSRGNFAVETRVLPPVPVRVESLDVNVDAQVTTAHITFNQLMDISSLNAALSVSQVRGEGDIEVRLIEGVDYTLTYDESTNTLNVTFDRDLIGRDLPEVPGLPGPGVYRFRLSEDLTRARLTRMPLDGDASGSIDNEDHYSQDAVVGDAGDKLTPDFAVFPDGYRVDQYGPANLDFVFDNDRNPDGLPDPNRTLTISGAIGDHPDNNANHFRFAGDVDLYSITLQAGQILRLSSLSGAAFGTQVTLLDENGLPISAFGTETLATSLPAPASDFDDPLTQAPPAAFLIRQTGTYILAIGDPSEINSDNVNNRVPVNDGELGSYKLQFTIFDDGDTGFSSTTNAGDGANVVNAPAPIDFAGLDATLGTADDPTEIIIADYTFTYGRGADGLAGTADDVVTGTNSSGITSTTTAAGRSSSIIQSSIGPAGTAGVVSEVASDVDVFHLNNRQPIVPGTKMRLVVRLTDLGSDLGSQAIPSNTANRGAVQLGVFDTSNSLSVDDGTVVFSPSEFIPYGGQANTVLANNGTTKYGFDSRGDFYIEFVAPERLGAPGQSGSFAVYLQGVINSPYELEVITEGTGTITPQTQNIFIETIGGSIDWLEAGGLTTQLLPFNPAVLGFNGAVPGGAQVGDYILNQLVGSLNGLFQGAGLDVNFSTDPADFEFQPFSTVYLSNAHDPIHQIFESFFGFNFQSFFPGSVNELFTTTQPFGASERSDPFNTSLEDESVVFVPSFAILGRTPSLADVNQFVNDLTGAVARRAGEMMGLRITTDNIIGNVPVTTYDPLAADSVTTAPTGAQTFTLSDQNRALSGLQDSILSTDFFLGRQRALSLLNQVVRGN